MWLTERVDLLSRLEVAEFKLVQHQQQVEALQAQLESANTLLHKKNCAIGKAETTIEALQRELLEWKRALCNLTPGGSEFADDHAYCAEWVRKARENQHDIIISKHRELKATQAALDAEREKVAAHERAYQEGHPSPCTLGSLCPYCEIERRAEQLTQLQALVRKLSKDFHLEDMRKAEAEAQKWEAEGDMYGWNFHQGRASGIREGRSIVYRIMRERGVDPMKALDATPLYGGEANAANENE